MKRINLMVGVTTTSADTEKLLNYKWDDQMEMSDLMHWSLMDILDPEEE